MKKTNIWTIWAVPLLVAAILLMLAGIMSYFQRLRVEAELSALLPDAPLASIHIASLSARLPQLSDSAPYRHILTAPAFQQLQQTPEWKEFAASFPEKFLLNPMRLIGEDVIVSIHENSGNEDIPPTLLLSRVDWVARKTEQLFYAYDTFSWKRTITVAQPGSRFAIYQFQQNDMLFPLYYTVIDDVFFLSTSLPLLNKTVKKAITTRAHPGGETPLLSVKIQPAEFLRTLARSPLFEIDQDALPAISPDAEFALSLDAFPDEIRLEAALSSVKTPWQGVLTQDEMTETPRLGISTNIEQDTAIFVGLNQSEITRMLEQLLMIFPKMERPVLLPEIAELQTMTDERIECQSSSHVAGVVYAMPDVSCLTAFRASPDIAMAAMQRTLTSVLDQNLPSGQRNMVKQSVETYRNAAMVKVALLFQELFAYGVVPSQTNGIGVLSASSKTLKREMDRLFVLEQAPPYRMTAERGAVAHIVIQPPQFADLLKNLAQTPTFAILMPKKKHPQFYASLPLALFAFNALPPIILDAQVNDATLTYSLCLTAP